jgi:hypothetical protein
VTATDRERAAADISGSLVPASFAGTLGSLHSIRSIQPASLQHRGKHEGDPFDTATFLCALFQTASDWTPWQT